MAPDDQKPPAKKENTKYEEAEEVGLEGLVPGKSRQEQEDAPPAEETKAPFDEA